MNRKNNQFRCIDSDIQHIFIVVCLTIHHENDGRELCLKIYNKIASEIKKTKYKLNKMY